MKRALLLLMLAMCVVQGGAMAQERRPNIVVLVADDWGFSDVGAFGGEMATPNIDDLARRGVRFANFHATASCSPSRAMLLTGVDNHLNGVGNMRETIPRTHFGRPGYLTVLSANVVTVATLLRDAGYRTYAAGKWHVGKEPHNLPPARGFDRSIVQGDSGSDNWETAKRYLDITDKVYWYEDGREADMPADYYSSQFFVDRTIEYLKSGATEDRPFFAYVAFQANHIPVQAPREFVDRYRGRYKQGWAALRTERRDRAAALGLVPADTAMTDITGAADWDSLSETDRQYQARRMEVYAGMAEAMDFHVGRLIAYLRETGAYDNTIFVFLSDNGAEASDPYDSRLASLWLDWEYRRDIDSLGAKGAYSVIGPGWASVANAPLGTYKFYAGEGGLRVPLIVAGVPGVQPGAIHRGFTHIDDIAPTLLELARVSRPDGSYQGRRVEPMSGRSLVPVMRDGAARAHPQDEAIGYELSGNEAVFKGDFKLVKNMPPVGDGQWHLFDILTDPGETRDLQKTMPELFTSLQADYAAYAKSHGVLPMPEGYEPKRQVLINALINVYVPRFRMPAILLAGALAALAAFLTYRRRHRRRA